MTSGKKIRLRRIINAESGKTVIVPMDHGATVGPLKGLENINTAFRGVISGGADAVVLHKGMIRHVDNIEGPGSGIIIHLSASTYLNPDPLNKISVCDVEEALSLGADAVSVHINIGSDSEADMLKFLGKTAKECSRWGVPLLAMMYPRGNRITVNTESVKIAARVGAELGADIIKCPYTGDYESFAEVVYGCPVPVVIAGGVKTEDEESFKMIEGAIKAGAAGISIGRNAFQHRMPELFIAAAYSIVHEGLSAEEALKKMKMEELKPGSIHKTHGSTFHIGTAEYICQPG